MTITIIGAGPVGILTAYFLKRRNISLPIKIYEKSNRPGGRMTSTRMKSIFDNKYSYLDFGAQYFSYDPNSTNLTKSQIEILNFLKISNILENFKLKNPKLAGEPTRYGGSERIRAIECNSKIWDSILRSHYLRNLEVDRDLFYSTKVDGNFLTEKIDEQEEKNLLISTVPVPQLVQILPSLTNHKLATSSYTCRFCLGYIITKSFFDEKIKNHPFYNEYRYLTSETSDKIIYLRFIENLNDRVGVMIHSQTILFNDDRVNLSKEEFQPILETEFCRLFNLDPEILMSNIHCKKPHKWLYTTPDRTFQEASFGCVKLKLLKSGLVEDSCSNDANSDGNLIVTGDAFCQTYPNFINSIEVAYKVANSIEISDYLSNI